MLLENRKAALCSLLVASALGASGCGGGSSVPPSTGTTITATFKGATPAAVAEQIGTGAWTAASLQGGQLTLTIPQGESRYAIAYVCPVNFLGSEFESVIEATTQDPVPRGFCLSGTSASLPPAKGAVTGSVDASAIPGASSVLIYGLLGEGSVPGVTGTFNIQMLPGLVDIAFVAVDTSRRVVAVKILRSQTVPGAANGGQTVVLAATDETAYQTISVTNVLPGFTGAEPATVYETEKGTFFPVIPISFSGPPVSHYAVVPATEAQASDKYRFSVSDIRTQPSGCTQQVGTQYASITSSSASASTVTLPLPAPLAYSQPPLDLFPSFDVSYTGFSANDSVEIGWSPTAGSVSNLTVTATAAYQNGAAALAVPDLTSLAGFLAAPSSGDIVSWSVTLTENASQPPGLSFADVINRGCYNEP
jgi:hypothetical protein